MAHLRGRLPRAHRQAGRERDERVDAGRLRRRRAREDLLARSAGNKALPTMLNYGVHVENTSLYNTPPAFGIYAMGLVIKWILDLGGLPAIAAINQRKASKLYAEIDRTGRRAGVGAHARIVAGGDDPAVADSDRLDDARAFERHDPARAQDRIGGLSDRGPALDDEGSNDSQGETGVAGCRDPHGRTLQPG